METRDSFIFYRSFYEAIKEIPEAEQLKVYKAITEYALNQNEIEIEGVSKAIFTLIRPQLDANFQKYLNGKKSKQNKSKIEASYKQSKSKSETNVNVNVNENVNVNDNDNVNVKDKKIHFADYVTMTNAEYEKLVSTYSKEFADQCITVLDNYKGANGKRYKSDYRAILSWVIEKVKQEQAKASKKQYEQRQYSDFDKFYSNM